MTTILEEPAASAVVDAFGAPVTTASRAAVRAFETAVLAMAAHRAEGAAMLERALARDRELAVAHLVRGFAAAALGRLEARAAGWGALAEARTSMARRGSSLRERNAAEALALALDDRPHDAAAALERTLEHVPTDLLSLKLAHGIRFMAGDAIGMRAALERVLPAWPVEAPGRGFALGAYAFALVETGELGRAERAGREAIALQPDDAWGAHAVAHVFESRDQPEEGAAWLDAHAPPIAGMTNFGAHVAWHRALFHLALGEHDAALALHDGPMLDTAPGDFRDLSNGASLLYRLEAAGVDVGERWARWLPRALAAAEDRGYAFADLFHVLVLARCGAPEADAVAAAMRDEGGASDHHRARVYRELGAPIAEGLIADLRGEHARAAGLLRAAHDGARALGGSEAQRELFRRIAVESAARACDADALRAALAAYRAARPHSPFAHAFARGPREAAASPGVLAT